MGVPIFIRESPKSRENGGPRGPLNVMKMGSPGPHFHMKLGPQSFVFYENRGERYGGVKGKADGQWEWVGFG